MVLYYFLPIVFVVRYIYICFCRRSQRSVVKYHNAHALLVTPKPTVHVSLIYWRILR